MITFNNSLEKALHCVQNWDRRGQLKEVTIIRDVYGKISFLMDSDQSISDEHKNSLIELLNQELRHFFKGNLYWKKLPHSRRTEAERIRLISEMIESERIFRERREDIDYFIAERPIAKKAWVEMNSLQNTAWSYEEAIAVNGTKIVTFYSFKGGMGRTTALAAVALNLIKEGKNVAMVDMDIEAPGLATLFLNEEVVSNGVLDYLLERDINPSVQIHDYMLDITDPILVGENDGNLYLMPAGKVDNYYLQKLARIDYQDNRQNHLRESIANMLLGMKQRYDVDYILIDARAGFHDLGGIAVAQIPHAVVLLGNDSRQSWDGMKQVLSTIAQGHDAGFQIMLVDTMCEKPTSANFAGMKEKFRHTAYDICVECFYDSEDNLPGIGANDVAHSPEFISFNDELLHGIMLYSQGNADENERVNAFKNHLIGESYEKITNRIRGWFGDDGTES